MAAPVSPPRLATNRRPKEATNGSEQRQTPSEKALSRPDSFFLPSLLHGMRSSDGRETGRSGVDDVFPGQLLISFRTYHSTVAIKASGLFGLLGPAQASRAQELIIAEHVLHRGLGKLLRA
jgi:hypothetical protein